MHPKTKPACCELPCSPRQDGDAEQEPTEADFGPVITGLAGSANITGEVKGFGGTGVVYLEDPVTGKRMALALPPAEMKTARVLGKGARVVVHYNSQGQPVECADKSDLHANTAAEREKTSKGYEREREREWVPTEAPACPA